MPRPRAYTLKGSFGKFNGTKVYYAGFKERPKFLSKTGRGFAGLKHLLEILESKFKNFTLTFTPEENSVRKQGKAYKVRLSAVAVRKAGKRRWDENRELNLRLGRQLLSETFPAHFSPTGQVSVYRRGLFAQILTDALDARVLAPEDRKAITHFLSRAASQGVSVTDIPAAYEATKDVQLLYLKNLVREFDRHVEEGHDEAWWQTYFADNILFFQDSYIRRLEKMNIIVAGTQCPDFAVVTSDGYLDILEIKKPGTALLLRDKSRSNYYWSAEIAKAISQVENYIDNVTRQAEAIRSKLRDDHGIDLRIIKPRGLIVAGTAASFGSTLKMADDCRRLNEGLKNVQVIPYDELSQRLRNTIVSIEKLANVGGRAKGAKQRKTKA